MTVAAIFSLRPQIRKNFVSATFYACCGIAAFVLVKLKGE